MDPSERRERRNKRREVRRRQQRDRRSSGDADPGLPPPADSESIETLREERRLRRQEVVLARHAFEHDEELEAFLDAEEFRREIDEVEKEFNLEEKAQELMFQALLSPTFEQALGLAEQAIRLDPDCVDARLILAAALTNDTEEYLDLLYRAVWAGERWLGEEYFEECKGRFWTVATTRPYMRALYQLGVTLMRISEEAEAVGVFEEMLELNPDDDQGARLFLMALFLSRNELEPVRALFEQYADDLTASAIWARLLERILADDEVGARGRLELARQWSPKVEAVLTGVAKVVDREPRDDDELAAFLMHAVVESHPRIGVWLRAHP